MQISRLTTVNVKYFWDYRYQVVTTSSSQNHVIYRLVIRYMYNVSAVNAIWYISWTTRQKQYTSVNNMSFLYNQVYNTSYSSQYHVSLGPLLRYNVLQQSISCTACATSQIPLITAVNIMYFMDYQPDTMSYSSQYHVLHGLPVKYHVLQLSISCTSWAISQIPCLTTVNIMSFIDCQLDIMSYSSSQCRVLLGLVVRYHVLQQSISCPSWTASQIPCLTAVNIVSFLDCQLDIMSYSCQYHVLLGLLVRYHVLQQSMSCPSWTASQIPCLTSVNIMSLLDCQSVSCTSCKTSQIQCLTTVNIMYFLDYKKMYLLKTTSQQSILCSSLNTDQIALLQQSISCSSSTASQIPSRTVNIMYFFVITN